MATKIGEYSAEETVSASGVRCTKCASKIKRGETSAIRGSVYRAEVGESLQGEYRTAPEARLCRACVPAMGTQAATAVVRHTYGDGWCPACGDEGCYADRGADYHRDAIAEGI